MELSEKNWKAFRFHQRCKAIGRFPDDPIVANNAGLIEGTIETIRDNRQQAMNELMAGLIQLTVKK